MCPCMCCVCLGSHHNASVPVFLRLDSSSCSSVSHVGDLGLYHPLSHNLSDTAFHSNDPEREYIQYHYKGSSPLLPPARWFLSSLYSEDCFRTRGQMLEERTQGEFFQEFFVIVKQTSELIMDIFTGLVVHSKRRLLHRPLVHLQRHL